MMATKPDPQLSRKLPLKKIYVGNLSFSSNDHDLAAMFTQYGEVASAKVVTDRDTGRSRGFGFVEMNDDSAADQAAASPGPGIGSWAPPASPMR